MDTLEPIQWIKELRSQKRIFYLYYYHIWGMYFNNFRNLLNYDHFRNIIRKTFTIYNNKRSLYQPLLRR